MAKWVFFIPIPGFLVPVRRFVKRVASRMSKPKRRAVLVLDDIGEAPPLVGIDGESTVESQIVAGLDAGALFLLRLLQDEGRNPETQALNVDFKQRLDAFKALNDYLVKRQKAKENGLDSGDDMPPYEQIRKSLDEKGFKIVPKTKVGRPTKEELELRKQILGEDEKPAPEDDRPTDDAPDSAMTRRLREIKAAKAGASENG